MSRCCATTARSPASATQLRERLLRRRARCLHRRRCARLQPRPGGSAEGARASRRCTSSARRSGPGAASASRRSRAPPTMCCASFRSSPSCCAEHGIAATYVGHPLADVIPMTCRARPRARALGLGADDDRGRAPAGQPALARSSTSRRACSAPRAELHAARPGLRFVLPVVPGLRHADRAAASRSTRPTCRSSCSTAVARGARRLRRDADRQRHRHARGGAVQAADGDRLPHELADLADHEAHAATSPGSACPTSCARLRRARAAAGRRRRPQALAAAALAWLDAPASAATALRARFDATAPRSCGATPPQLATDAIEKVLDSAAASSAPRAGIVDSRADGRRRRGRPRPAGRPGGGGGGDPRRRKRRSAAWPIRRCCTPMQRERLYDEIRAKALCCSRRRRPASRRSTAQHPAGDACWRCGARSRACA